MQTHYLIHLPHCGTNIPKEELTKNIYQYADLYTDELFGDMYQCFGGAKNEYSRLFFDPERFGDDNQEQMHQKFRLGWFYENAILSNKPLRKKTNKSKIRAYFDAHHKQLNEKTKSKLELHNKCTVIDCHSFSNERYWFHDKNLQLPDICIGFEEFHKDDTLIEAILEEFAGYKIGINTPYNGSSVPTDYWQKDNRVKSVMLEINKKLYLESDNITKSKEFPIVQQKITNILNNL